MLNEGKISYERLWILMKEKNVSTFDIRRKNVLSEATLQRLRSNDHIGGNVSTNAIASLCAILDCQPGDIMQYLPNDVLKERGML